MSLRKILYYPVIPQRLFSFAKYILSLIGSIIINRIECMLTSNKALIQHSWHCLIKSKIQNKLIKSKSLIKMIKLTLNPKLKALNFINKINLQIKISNSPSRLLWLHLSSSFIHYKPNCYNLELAPATTWLELAMLGRPHHHERNSLPKPQLHQDLTPLELPPFIAFFELATTMLVAIFIAPAPC